MSEITAKLKYLNIAPRKTRFVADLIRGLPVEEAEAELLLQGRRPSAPLLKLLRSAVANAKNNHKVDPVKLYIKEIKVDEGPVLKRFMPRAFGRINLIEKKTSHVTLILGLSDKLEKSRFVIKEKPKKEKKVKAEKKPKEEREGLKEKKPVSESKKIEKPGFFRRVFRRKSV